METAKLPRAMKLRQVSRRQSTRATEVLGTNKAVLLTRLALQRRITSMKDKMTVSERRKGDEWN